MIETYYGEVPFEPKIKLTHDTEIYCWNNTYGDGEDCNSCCEFNVLNLGGTWISSELREYRDCEDNH